MSNLLFFITFVIVCFGVVCVAISLFKKDAIFTLSIGAVIGANVYNIGSYPVEIGKLVFGMDGVVYTIFLFCLLIMLIDYGKKDMHLVLYTAMFSIFFTALLAFFGSYLQNGAITESQIWSTLSYIFSILGTYVAVICMMFLYQKLRSKNFNNTLAFIACLLIGNLINSIIYFGLTFVVTGSLGENFVYSLMGSFITKFLSTLICAVVYFVYEKYWNKQIEKTKDDSTNE